MSDKHYLAVEIEELSGEALEWAVGKALGYEMGVMLMDNAPAKAAFRYASGAHSNYSATLKHISSDDFNEGEGELLFTKSLTLAGMLMREHKLGATYNPFTNLWESHANFVYKVSGETVPIAVARAFVANFYGIRVIVPSLLVPTAVVST